MSMAEEMWALVPAVYRRRDVENGDVLRALIEVLGEQAGVIRDDIARLYDNAFIETCDEWAVPYIGELVGARPVTPRGEPAGAADRAAMAKVASARMLVANAVRWRRRKGAFALLTELAWDIARWPALAVEFGARLAVFEDMRFPGVSRGTLALRDPAPLARLGGAEDTASRTIDVRAADAARSPGRFGPGNVGLFVFRHDIVAVDHVNAAAIDEEEPGCFTFDPLGRDLPLYHPSPKVHGEAPPRPPGAITRASLASRRRDDDPEGPGWRADPAIYGREGCLMIWEQREDEERLEPVAPERIVPANLHGWRRRPSGDQVTIDPELGRIAFSEQSAPWRLRVRYTYCGAGGVGAPLAAAPEDEARFDAVLKVAASREEAHDSLRAALEQWRKGTARSTLIEFHDSGTYDEERLAIDLSRGERRLVVRARPGCRPVVRLADRDAGAIDGWHVRGARDGVPGPAEASLALDGLTIAGRGLIVERFAGALSLRNCTLVPGCGGGRGGHGPVSIALENCSGGVTIDHSIVGPIVVRADEAAAAPLPLTVRDSILDAGEGHDALSAPDAIAYAKLDLARSTVLGRVAVHSIGLVENAIFAHGLDVARRQAGCLRYSFVPPGSRTPRRFACLPASGGDQDLAPTFVSRALGMPGYAELAANADRGFFRGADDQGELGAFHDRFQPLREANLRAVLAEHLPASANAGIIHLS